MLDAKVFQPIMGFLAPLGTYQHVFSQKSRKKPLLQRQNADQFTLTCCAPLEWSEVYLLINYRRFE